ncbi:hypothetical protein D9C73_001899 [Collichthys lucidus]|uniref:Uncharacterized protein n=1 Tax=Collichthys lucidus TaxID=240159 RepID=A0A4U5TZG0_COLLU|nr:hypothetical protein D9C73_001899 [Collichthys lucidus]
MKHPEEVDAEEVEDEEVEDEVDAEEVDAEEVEDEEVEDEVDAEEVEDEVDAEEHVFIQETTQTSADFCPVTETLITPVLWLQTLPTRGRQTLSRSFLNTKTLT